MKTTLKYLSLATLATLALTWPLFRLASTENEEALAVPEDPAAREASRRLELQDENGQIPINGLIDAYKATEEMEFLPEAWAEFRQGTEPNVVNPWVSIGPGNIGGRIRSLIIHPTANPRTIWAGGVSGGVWKSTNGGDTWNLNTGALAILGVSCMAIDPTNPDILYAGTGEVFLGNGIYKTMNGGGSWEPLISTTGNENFNKVGRLAISPTNSQLLLAATNTGVFRSENGGETWSPKLTVPNIHWADVRFRPNNGIAAAAADPDDPEAVITCLAGSYEGHVYYSTDNGETWVTNINNGLRS